MSYPQCCLPCGLRSSSYDPTRRKKAGELQILRCQGIKVTDYNFTLDTLALKPSDFSNVRVTSQPTHFLIRRLIPSVHARLTP